VDQPQGKPYNSSQGDGLQLSLRWTIGWNIDQHEIGGDMIKKLLAIAFVIGAPFAAFSDEAWDYFDGPIHFTNLLQGVKPMEVPVLTERSFFGVYLGETIEQVSERARSIPLSFTNVGIRCANPSIQYWEIHGVLNNSTNIETTSLTTINGRVYAIIVEFKKHSDESFLGLYEGLKAKYGKEHKFESSYFPFVRVVVRFESDAFTLPVSVILRSVNSEQSSLSIEYQYDAMSLSMDRIVKQTLRDSVKEDL
jgi:hypothetical protein